jgi:hypothetical protein
MATRVGVGMLLLGALFAVISLFVSGGGGIKAPFWGWRVMIYAGILLITLGISTAIIEPVDLTGIVTAIGTGILGQIIISSSIIIAVDGYSDLLFTLLEIVVPLLPATVGYALGAFRSVSGISKYRRYRLCLVSTFAGVSIWIASYILLIAFFDTTGEVSLDAGFLFVIYLLLLLVDMIFAVILYAHWRLL